MQVFGLNVQKNLFKINSAVALMAGVFCAVLYGASRQRGGPLPAIFSLVAAHDVDGVRAAVSSSHSIVKSVDLNGSTPLDIALVEGDQKLIDVFLDAGADVNARNNAGVTPLFFAVASKNRQTQLDALTKLLDHGADPNIRLPDGTHILHLLARECKATDPRLLLVLNKVPDHPAIRDSKGRTPADIADASGHHAAADWLRLRIHD